MNWLNIAVLAAVLAVFAGLFVLRRRRVNFSVVTLIALAAAVPIGLLGRGHADYVAPIGRIYLSVLLAAVAPLIIVSIISSVASLGTIDRLRSIGLRSFGWLLGSNAIAVVLTLAVALAVGTGRGLNEQEGGHELSVLENSVQSFGDVIVGFFPTNIVSDVANNRIIPIILVSVVVSIAYLALARRHGDAVRPFLSGVNALKLVIFRVVGYVVRLTPYAIVGLTVTAISDTENLGDTFWSLLGLLGLTWGICLAHTYLVNGVILRVFADVSPWAFFRKIFPAQVTAFTTQSSLGTLPVTTNALTQRVGVDPQVAHFTAPLGTTIGMPGCSGVWPIIIAVWGIHAYGISYSVQDYIVLAILGTIVSIGVAGVPGTATVAAATVLAAAGLPLEFIAVTLPISVIADMARTLANVTAAATSATVVAHQTGMLDRDVFNGTATPDEGASSIDEPVAPADDTGAHLDDPVPPTVPVSAQPSLAETYATSPAWRQS